MNDVEKIYRTGAAIRPADVEAVRSVQRYIVIDSKLSPLAGARLRRHARYNWEAYWATRLISELAFVHAAGRKRYFPILADADYHAVARRMMTVCGETFTYRLGE